MSLLVVFSEWLGDKLQEDPEACFDFTLKFLFSFSGKSGSLTARDIICRCAKENKFFKLYVSCGVLGNRLFSLFERTFEKTITESFISCDNFDADLDTLAIHGHLRCLENRCGEQELKRLFIAMADCMKCKYRNERDMKVEQVGLLFFKVNLYLEKINISGTGNEDLIRVIHDLANLFNIIIKKNCPRRFIGKHCDVEYDNVLFCKGLPCEEECPREKFLNERCLGFECKIKCCSGKFFIRGHVGENETGVVTNNLLIDCFRFCDAARALNFD